jgi:WD40 repeat protein
VGLDQAPSVARVLRQPFVARRAEFKAVTSFLRSSKHSTDVPIIALWGPCGSGKTALAWHICQDNEIRETLPDRPLWMTLGNCPDGITSRVQDLIDCIEGERPSVSNPIETARAFRALLQSRKSLIVVDDLWDNEHLLTLTEGISSCVWLVTTDDKDTLRENSQSDLMVKINEMPLDEAVELLKVRVEKEPQLRFVEDDLLEIAERLDRWPVLLSEAGRYLANRISDGYLPSEAVESLNENLDENGLDVLDTRRAVTARLEACLKRLNEKESLRLCELAVFPKGAEVPLTVVAKHWASSPGVIKQIEVQNLCSRFYRLSLLCKSTPRSMSLYNGISQVLQWQQQDNLFDLHNRFLDAYPFGPVWLGIPESEHYLWEHLAYHLIGAGRSSDLVETVKDWQFLATKLCLRMVLSPENNMLSSLEDDLFQAQKIADADRPVAKLRDEFMGISHLFDQHWMDEEGIKATLFARLQHLRDDLTPMFDGLERSLGSPYIVFRSDLPTTGSSFLPYPLGHHSGEGHRGFVTSCAYSAARERIVSASSDHTLKVWNTQTGEVVRTLKDHRASVNGCAVNHDSTRIVSASSDRTLRVWDADSGEVQHVFKEHSASVNGCAFSPDGTRIVSASSDRTLIIWDAGDGRILHTLKRIADWGELMDENGDPVLDDDGQPIEVEGDVQVDGHSAAVNDCAFNSDGKLIVSASDDGTLKIWDTESGELRETLQDRGQSGFAKSCAWSGDDKLIVSASSDGRLTVWDALERRVVQTLGGKQRGIKNQAEAATDGHAADVNDCAFALDNNLIVSASDDRTLKVWEASSEKCVATFYDYGALNCCSFEGDTIIAGGEGGVVYLLRLVREAPPVEPMQSSD